MPEPRDVLTTLFTELFSAEELRQWVHRVLGEAAFRRLPAANATLDEVGFEAAGLAKRHGRIDDGLFAALLDVRPGQRTRILDAARRCRVSISRRPHAATTDADTDEQPRVLDPDAALRERIEMAEVPRRETIEEVVNKLVYSPGRHQGIVVLGSRKSGRVTFMRQLQAHLQMAQPSWEIVAFSMRPRADESVPTYLARMRACLRLDQPGDRLVACINGWSLTDRSRTAPIDDRVQAFANELRACLEDPAARRPFSMVAIGGYGLYHLRNGERALSVLNIAAQVDLPSLSEDEVYQLMQTIGLHHWNRQDAAAVWQRSGGHPLLTKRLLRAWCDEPLAGWDHAARALEDDEDYLLPAFRIAANDPAARAALRRCLHASDGIKHSKIDARSAGNYLLYAGLLRRLNGRLGLRCAAVRALVEQCIGDDPTWGHAG